MKGIMGGNEYRNGMPSAKSSKQRRDLKMTKEEKNAEDVRRMYERNEDEKRIFEI